MAEENNFVYVANMTNFYNRELFMYSLGDIKFKKPIALKKVAYTTFFIIIITIPAVLIWGLILNPYFLAVIIGIPLVLGNYAAKPVWQGRGLLDFLKTIYGYIFEPSAWMDLEPSKPLEQEVYYTNHEIWISRRREFQLLADMKEEREKNQGQLIHPEKYFMTEEEEEYLKKNNTIKKQPKAVLTKA